MKGHPLPKYEGIICYCLEQAHVALSADMIQQIPPVLDSGLFAFETMTVVY